MLDKLNDKIEIRIKDVKYKTDTMVLSYFVRKNRHSNGLIFYIKGSHHHDMENGDQFSTAPFQLLYLPYNSTYTSTVTNEKIEYYQIDFELFSEGKPISLFDEYKVISFNESSGILSRFIEIFNLYTLKPAAYNISAISHLLALIAIIAGEDAVDQKNAGAAKRICAGVNYINVNYAKNTDVKELAALCNMSVSSFEKNFIKAMGQTPIAYRNSIRIEHAKTLLLGGFSISEVWERVGYSDMYYFAKSFKRFTGISPGKYTTQSQIKNSHSAE